MSSLRPRYQQTYPDTLATMEELRALGLRPGTSELDAILEYTHQTRTGVASARCLSGRRRCPSQPRSSCPEGGFNPVNEEGDLSAALISFI